jgi:hypothetical protein
MLIRTFLIALILSFAAAGHAHAGTPHLRPLTETARRVIERGLAESSTFRELVQRLNRSDVIVYVEEDLHQSKTLAGRLSFLTTGGGFRFVRVWLQWRPFDIQQVATLAHELQHALEIAGRPDVVDQESLGRAFSEIGHQRRAAYGPSGFYDTAAAIETGDRVWRELAGRDTSAD